MPIGVRFPFIQTNQGGMFGTTKTSSESVRSNLVSLLTTKRGHRVMNSLLYSPIYDYIFEPWDDISQTNLEVEIKDKIADFVPEASVEKITTNFEEENNVLNIKIFYKIPSLGGVKDVVSLTININEEL